MSSETLLAPFAITAIAAARAHTPWSAMSPSRSIGRLSKRRYPALYSVVLLSRQKSEDGKANWRGPTLS